MSKGGTRGICSVAGCGRPHYGLSFCGMHHRRWKKHGSTDLPAKKRVYTCKPTRKCCMCKLHKERSAFSPVGKGTNVSSRCRKCDCYRKNHSKSIETKRRKAASCRRRLANTYVRMLLRRETGLWNIPMEMVEAKRIQLANRRYILEVLNVIKTNQTRNNDDG